jgi:hypothetical protein
MASNKSAARWGLVAAAGLLALPALAAGPSVSFRINEGRIEPSSEYAVKVSIIGCAFTSNGVPQPITVSLKVDDERAEPFGDADSTQGNVNQPSLAVSEHIVPDMQQVGTSVTIEATSWYSNGRRIMSVDSHDERQNVKVLRNGDPVPNIAGFDGQEQVEYFLEPYLTDDGAHIWLHPNQAIYLFELGTTNVSSSAADFQDVVVLVTLGTSIEQLENEEFGPVRDYAVPMQSPAMAD